jgi:hypothetical protein
MIKKVTGVLFVFVFSSILWAQQGGEVSEDSKTDLKKVTEGLTFYTGFDQSLKPTNFAGTGDFSGDFYCLPGRVNGGFNNRQGSGASYGEAGNVNPQRGTVSLWVKPEKMPDTGSVILFSTNRFVLTADAGHKVVFFMTGSTPAEQDFRWDYSLSVPFEKFPPDRWTHVALIWDQMKGPGKQRFIKKIFIDGKPAGSTKVDQIDGTDKTFNVGGSIHGVFDELMIWDRVLTSAQIHQLYSKPEAVAKEMNALAPLVKERRWLVYPDLVYRNFTDSLVGPGDVFSIKVPLENRTDQKQSGKLILTVLDLWEKPYGRPVTSDFSLGPKEKKEIPAQFSVNRFGIFKIEAAVVIGDRRDFRDVTTFGCIPPGNPPKHSFFGTHVQQWPNEPEMARRLGFSANRSHNMTQYTWWRCMEYEQGKWDLVQKGFYDKINALGMDHLGQWFAAPNWAVTLSDGRHPEPISVESYPKGWVPTDMAAYKNYVRESIKRYPAIREWEIWNEPYCSLFWLGSPQDYVNLCKASYKTAKSVRPDLKIYAQFADTVWGRETLKEGLLNYCDGLTYHWYSGPGRWDDAHRMIRDCRKTIRKFTKKNIPLMNSECGIATTTFLRGLDFSSLPPESKREPMNYRLGAERIVQYFVTTMAEGVERWYYYYHTLGETYSGWSTIELTKTPKPFAVALCMLAWQLDGGNYICNKELKGPIYAYLFDRKDGSSVAVLWTEDEGVMEMKSPGTYFDLMGNPVENTGTVRVTDAPMYLRYKGKANELAKSLDQAQIKIVKAPVRRQEIKAGVVGPKVMSNFSVASELGKDRLIPLDLRAAANMALADDKQGDGVGGLTDEGPYNDLRDLKPGNYTWLGVPFIVIDPARNHQKAVLTMCGTTLPAGPKVSFPIAVDRKVRGLFFAHLANHAMNSGTPAGEYEILYADGTRQTIPIIVGTNIFNWWHDQQENEDSRTVPVKVSQSLEDGNPYRFFRIWYWENPKGNVPVKSVIMKNSRENGPTTVLIGITAAVW